MPWQQLTVTTHHDAAQLISDELDRLGALSVTMQDAADEPLYEPAPEETKIWQQTRVTGLFDDQCNAQALMRQLREGPLNQQCSQILCETLEDQNWETTWLDDFHPMQFGDGFWVCATEHERPDPQATILILDPGLAFGTGTHPTTAMCLSWLAAHRGEFQSMVDFGCGSGILAIAALLLGCQSAVGIDIDPQALEATRENAQKNQVADQMATYPHDDYPKTAHPLVVANILAGPLMDLSQVIGELVQPSGHLVLSGVLQDQGNAVAAAYADRFQEIHRDTQEDWVCLHLQKHP